MAINYCIAQNFHMSLISRFSRIFNSSRKYLGFVTRHTVLMLCLQSIDRQYPGAMLLNLHRKFSKYIQYLVCHAHNILRVWHACAVDSLNLFRQNLQKLLFVKILNLENLALYGIQKQRKIKQVQWTT